MFAMIALAACLSSSIEAPPPPVPPLRPFVQDQLKAREVFGPLIGASLDEVLGDALTRRLLPRGVLHRKTDGFDGRSPLASRIGVNRAETLAPVLFGMLPDPSPMSSLRILYEHILGVPLDRGNFRRQFLEVIDLGPLVALPIFQRGVPHRAGQLFTFDHRGWERW